MLNLKKFVSSKEWNWDTKREIFVHCKYREDKIVSTAGKKADYSSKTGNNPRYIRWFGIDFSQQVRFMIEMNWIKNHLLKIGNDRKEREKNITESILDLGCSRSYIYQFWRFNCNHFGWKPVNYYGVDANAARIQQGRESFVKKRRDNLVYFLADLIFPLSFYRKFDVVVCGEVIEHLPKEYQEILLETIRNSMRKNSILIFSSPNPRKDMGELFISEYEHLYESSYDEMENLLDKTGFQIVDSCGILARQGYKTKCEYPELRSRLSDLLSTTIAHGILVTGEKDKSLSKQYLIKAVLK